MWKTFSADEVRKCALCRGEYSPKAINQRYCGEECTNEAMRQRSMERNRQYREKAKRKTTGMRLAEINAAARAAGLNYGEYVAKMHL